MADLLPVEIWRDVFELSCRDGGYTSTSLSRVSKAFRSLSAAYRFHSVRLSKLRDIEKFITSYEAAISVATAGDNDPPRVRYLLLSFLPGETDVTLLEGAIHFRDFHSWQESMDEWNSRFVDLLAHLFTLVGSHLETMTFLQSKRIPLPFIRHTFPALRELTLLEDDRVFVRLPDEPSDDNSWITMFNTDFYAMKGPLDLNAPPPFPALIRLHVIGGSSKLLPWRTTLPVWALLAPCLAHLRVSAADEKTLQDVRGIMRTVPFPFSTLQTLTIQPTEEAQVDFSKDALPLVLQGASGRQVGCKLTPPPVMEDPDKYWPQQLAQEWSRWQ